MTIDLSSINQMAGPMLNAMPQPVFIVDEDLAIIALNDASRKMIGINPEVIIKRRAGEILHCIHSSETEDGCGRAVFCCDCIVRRLVNKAFKEHMSSKENAKMEIVTAVGVEEVYLSVIASPFEYNEKLYVNLLLENITELIELRKIIPICSSCNKVRNDDEYWQKVESYFNKYLDIKFTHGICPDCVKKIYPDMNIDDKFNKQK